MAIVAGLFAAAPVRAAIWTIALAWMGSACILNARRCGRTHCRFTGPYYLATIIPVIGFGSGQRNDTPVGNAGGAAVISSDKLQSRERACTCSGVGFGRRPA